MLPVYLTKKYTTYYKAKSNPELVHIEPAHYISITGKGVSKNGHHHEIYLNDPRKTAPEKLKTILREPVKKRSK